jgi:hypothetical protein
MIPAGDAPEHTGDGVDPVEHSSRMELPDPFDRRLGRGTRIVAVGRWGASPLSQTLSQTRRYGPQDSRIELSLSRADSFFCRAIVPSVGLRAAASYTRGRWFETTRSHHENRSVRDGGAHCVNLVQSTPAGRGPPLRRGGAAGAITQRGSRPIASPGAAKVRRRVCGATRSGRSMRSLRPAANYPQAASRPRTKRPL